MLGSGCSFFQKPDPELVATLQSCKTRKAMLDQEYNSIVNKIYDCQNKNKAYMEKCHENAQYLNNIIGRYKSFWKDHAQTISRTDAFKQDETPADLILFCDGTPQMQIPYSQDETTIFDCILEPYAQMSYLSMPTSSNHENKLCIVMDAALEPMLGDGKINGFEIMLENIDEIQTIGIVILNENNEFTKYETFNLAENSKNIIRIPIVEHTGWEILKLTIDDIPIKKGQHWGLLVPCNVRIPCSYIGTLSTIPEEFKHRIGGDVRIASFEPDSNSIQNFESPKPDNCTQRYPDDCTLPLELFEKNERIKMSLKPSITFAVYGIIQNVQ